MIEINCPWCDTALRVPARDEAEEQTCGECLTTWSYESAEPELAIAA
jgi:hypothetical protein